MGALFGALRGRCAVAEIARDPLPGAEHTGGDRRLAGAQRPCRLTIGEPQDVDGDERETVILRQGRDAGDDLAGLHGLLGASSRAWVHRFDVVELARGDLRPARSGPALREKGVAQHP